MHTERLGISNGMMLLVFIILIVLDMRLSDWPEVQLVSLTWQVGECSTDYLIDWHKHN